MQITLILAITLFVGGWCLNAAESLPVTPAETLAGQKLSFPAALAGKSAVCVFGFSKEAGDRTKDWMARLNRDGVNAWSIASLEGAPGLVRGMIRASMRKGTPQPLLEHSLVMIKDEQTWRHALGVSDEKLPVVVVLDASGRTIWIHEGLFGDEAYRELRTRLTAVAGN